MGRLSDIPDHDSFFDPPDYCNHPDCDTQEYKKGLCLEHYLEYEESKADYIHDERRDREYERNSSEPR